MRALSRVAARETTVPTSPISRFSSGVGRGVVVTTSRGCLPRRRPNCSMSHVSSPWRHLHSSSAQAAANCGPRRASGSSAENTIATAPFGHSSRRRVGIHCGRSLRGWIASRPETPSTMTSRTSAIVSPTRAMGETGSAPSRPSACALTHSAPVRVLPAPRPPRTSHTVHSPGGASWSGRAKKGQ